MERSLGHLQHVLRNLLEALRDAPPVHLAVGQRPQDEQTERALENVALGLLHAVVPSTIIPLIPFFMAEAAPAPRLVVTDALGRRIVNIDKSLFTIGRRSETDLRLPGADISRVHAEITVENGNCVIRDKQSRFGTYVNGVKVTSEKVLGHGDQIKLGNSGDTEILFFVDDEAPSVEKSAISAATELRQLAALLENLRALGSGRMLDEVLAMVLDSAIEVTGAER